VSILFSSMYLFLDSPHEVTKTMRIITLNNVVFISLEQRVQRKNLRLKIWRYKTALKSTVKEKCIYYLTLDLYIAMTGLLTGMHTDPVDNTAVDGLATLSVAPYG